MNVNKHIRQAKHLVLLWFVLFSLSPCTVKEAVFRTANIDYAKPPNKSRTVTPTNLCHYSPNDNQQTAVAKKSEVNNQIEPTDFFGNKHFVVRSFKGHNRYSKTSSGSSPPKYILYKRLKIDIA